MIGTVSKLVASFGSTWGLIKPVGESREVFFNANSLVDHPEYALLVVGQDVEFDEEFDQANRTHALRVSRTAANP